MFEEFKIDKRLLDAVFATGYATPTPVQQAVIGPAIEGRDIIASAPTGTGKTAAFLVPIIDFIIKNPRGTGNGRIRTVILSPTTELAFQTRDFALKLSDQLNIKVCTVVGKSGISSQLQELRAGTDIVIATPGRALELVLRRELHIESAEICVVDETDRMTDLGFITEVSKLIEKLSFECQIMFFSATLSKISARIAGKASREPLLIDINETISKKILKIPDNITLNVLFAEKDRKKKVLMFMLKELKNEKIIIFVDSKAAADSLSREITDRNINTGATVANVCLHSDKTLVERNHIIEKFIKGTVKILVATDIAARGLDFPDVSAVISVNVPSSPTLLVHRAGRTGRIGPGSSVASGLSVAKAGRVFCICSAQERMRWYDFVKEIDCKCEVFPYHPYHSDKIENMSFNEAKEKGKWKKT